jgi:hypothetical protein
MRIACWINNAADTRSKNAILIASLQQQWLRERASALRYTVPTFACLVMVTASVETSGARSFSYLSSLYASPNNAMFMKSKKTRRAGHLARLEE